MVGYIGTKAVNLSTTGADINGDANVDGSLTVGGDVGIGASPTADSKVYVYGADALNKYIRTENNNGSSYFGTIGDGAAVVESNTYTKFTTGGSYTEAMRINSSGNVYVGHTNNLGGNLSVVTTPSKWGIAVVDFVNNQALVSFVAGGTQVGRITHNGSSTQYLTTSDYRLKENVTPVQGAGDIVKAMRPVTYTYKNTGIWADGFLAHELQELHPIAVNGEKDAMRDEEYEVTPAVEATFDDEGVELTPAEDAVMGTRNVPDHQHVDYSKLTPILTAALQEALNKIDALTARIETLEAK